MEINIKTFGIARDFIGEEVKRFQVKEGISIAELKEDLVEKYPDFEKLKAFSIAVNLEYQEDDYTISGGDEIAIIPPVSGG